MKYKNDIVIFFAKQILFYLFLLSSLLAKSQSPYYYQLTEEDGLPSSEVYQVLQDNFGYIWIGCDAGLYRYDGVRFKSYTNKKQNGKSISGLRIDRDGKLWCQNFSGQIYVVDSDSLKLFADLSLRTSSYNQFTIDFNKQIWIANQTRLDVYDFKGKQVQSLYKLNSNKDTVIWNEIEIDNKGHLYAASLNDGLAEIKFANNNYMLELLSNTQYLSNRTSLEPYKEGLIALTEENPIRKYIVSEIKNHLVTIKNSILPFTPNGNIYKICKDNLNRNWVCTSNGISQLTQSYQVDKTKSFFLQGDKISGLFQDREGNLWISSLQNGIYIVPNYDLEIYNQQNSVLKDHNISALHVDGTNTLYVGSFSGLIYQFKDSVSLKMLNLKEGMSYRTVKKFIDYKGKLFIAHGPMSVIDKGTYGFYNLFNLRDFCWLGDTMFVATPNSFGYIPDFFSIKESAYGKYIEIVHAKSSRAIAANVKEKTVYYASIDGLFKYCNGTNTELKLKGKSIFVNKLCFKNNQLWVGSVNEGLLVFENDKFVKQFSENNLLSGTSVKSFRVLNHDLWVATEKGLNQIDINNNKFKLFDYTDGIVSKEINDIEVWNGRLYLATNKGLYRFPNVFTENKVIPNIEILEIKNNNELIAKDEKLATFNYDQNNLVVKFNSACFKARGKFVYQYRLLGLDSTWRTNSALENEISYSSLPSGSFTFQVIAVNEVGVKSLKSAEFSFIITKPLWQQWWFYVFMFIVAVFIVILISVLIIRNIRKKAMVKNELISSQLTAIRAQMNPHFMYNTLNSIQDLILKNEIKNTNYYLSKFSTLMRKILEFSETEKILLEEEIEMLNSYLELEKLRFGNDFKFQIIVHDSVDVYKTYIPSLIIQPFVENSIKHGLLHKKGAKELLVTFEANKNETVVIIDDNGVGRKRSAEIKQRSQIQHKSFATDATQKRLELLNKNSDQKIAIEIIDKYDGDLATGTKVILKFPNMNLNS